MMRKLLAIIFLSPFVISAHINIKEVQTNKLDSVMFVGNSFFYYNNSLHNHLRKIISGDNSVKAINTRSITINGSSLSWHPVDAYLDNKNIGSFRIDSKNDNKYIESKDTSIDAVIFMDCSLCSIHPKTKDNFHKYVAKHSETIRTRGAEPILFMSWPYKNKKDMVFELREEFIKAANANDILLVPAGEAFHNLNLTHPEIDLYTPDMRHPSAEGTYLAAAVVFGTLFKKKTEGNKNIMNLDPEDALKIQKIADKTVNEFFN
jgi:hypothetical protein|tara:strand:- start:836 stop:1621 length:786 start_codon:yes stop_codon:yes gene_type:complete